MAILRGRIHGYFSIRGLIAYKKEGAVILNILNKIFQMIYCLVVGENQKRKLLIFSVTAPFFYKSSDP